MKRKNKNLAILFILLALILFTTYLFARAGGAGSSGGGSHSSGGSSGDGGAIIYLIYMLIRIIYYTVPFPFNFVVIGLLIAGAIYVLAKGKGKVQEKSVYNDIPSEPFKKKKAKGFSSFMDDNPDFDEESFKDKVEDVFMQVQQAWMDMELKHVRKFMSDGVFQRFNTQFKMMNLLKQKNVLSNIKVNDVFIDKVEKDGMFDIMHVGIMAEMYDDFKSELDPSLDMGGYNKFVEYWSFIRKRGIPRKDMFDVPKCPSCDGLLDDGLGEICKCPYCNSLLNSGEYDWVLSEITQSDDYVSKNPKVGKKANLSDMVEQLIAENDDFSVQFIEDRASNGYLQILTAKAYHDLSIMRRFVSDRLYSKTDASKKNYITSYNRIFLNDVSLIGIQEETDVYKLFISVKSSFQRVKIEGSKVEKIDPFVMSETEVVVMTRQKNAGVNKGSIYSHNCPACGGLVKDTLDINCQYCGTPLNSNKNEWIIDDVLTVSEYSSYLDSNKSDFDFSIDPKMLDSMIDVRDFAFNNVLVIVAADHVFDENEKIFVNKLAKKWGYNPNKIQGLYNLAASGDLVIKMPEDMKKREKIYKIMEKAAMADGNISVEERQMLDKVKEVYLQRAG